MKMHTQIINNYIKKVHAKVYVEIGVQNAASNFDLVQCPQKYGVDPDPEADGTHKMTSDDFFVNCPLTDVFFIDGLHEALQVQQDIVNASKNLTVKGVIILHDLNPKEEIEQIVPRQNKVWTGDCWRAFVGFRKKYPRVKSYCYREDHGVGIIFPNGTIFEGPFVSDISWDDFNKNKRRLLNLI